MLATKGGGGGTQVHTMRVSDAVPVLHTGALPPAGPHSPRAWVNKMVGETGTHFTPVVRVAHRKPQNPCPLLDPLGHRGWPLRKTCPGQSEQIAASRADSRSRHDMH